MKECKEFKTGDIINFHLGPYNTLIEGAEVVAVEKNIVKVVHEKSGYDVKKKNIAINV